MKNDQCDRVARGRLLLVFTFVCAQGRRARVFPYAEDHIRMSGRTHGVHTYTIKESELMKPLLKQTTWLRLRRGENQVRTPWVMKSCVNARQGCVFFSLKAARRNAPPPLGSRFGRLISSVCRSLPGERPLAELESRARVRLRETHVLSPWSRNLVSVHPGARCFLLRVEKAVSEDEKQHLPACKTL